MQSRRMFSPSQHEGVDALHYRFEREFGKGMVLV